MKKHLLRISLVVLTSLLIIPQVSLAAWWNPFSWKIFNKAKTPNIEVQKTVPVSEVEKLRIEIEELKKSNASIGGVATPNATESTPSVKLTNSQIIKKIKPATVYIETQDNAGSGMIFTTDGYVLTNAHVVKGYSYADISISSGETLSGKVVGRDEEADLAVLKIDSGKSLSKVSFGNSDKTEQGDEVFALGFPFGIKGDVSFKEGTVSRRIEGYLETSVEIHPGNSGGPLVNRYGQVIGVNTAIYGKSVAGIQVGETIKLAIPINTAKNLIAGLKTGSSKVVQKIYGVIPLDDISNLTFEDQTARRKIYEEFLKTPGLQYMTPEKQTEILNSKLEPYLRELTAQLRREVEVRQAKNDQMKAIAADCDRDLRSFDSAILARQQRYYADIAVPSGPGESGAMRNARIQELTRQANVDIQNLETERETERIDCQNRLDVLRY